jgi:hypothetical protein
MPSRPALRTTAVRASRNDSSTQATSMTAVCRLRRNDGRAITGVLMFSEASSAARLVITSAHHRWLDIAPDRDPPLIDRRSRSEASR